MQSVSLIFPHQLFKQHSALNKNRQVIIIEEWLYFRQYNFHKQKLILHRASMQFYKDWLSQNGFDVLYIDTKDARNDIRNLVDWLRENNCKELHYADVADDWLRRRMQSAAKRNEINLIEYTTPQFLNTLDEVKDFFNKQKIYFQTDFYIWQRKKRNILLASANQPEGGKWSFDAENRKKFPKGEVIPVYNFPATNKYVDEAKEYVAKYFPHNNGNANATTKYFTFRYPVNFEEAENWLNDFIIHRFANFGVYEDAIVKDENFLYHSVFLIF